ncbi:MAG TPA: ABC transporter substrate-binding protein [Thermomicrobiales bacterium]|nr:ABC transporter substrate-binding protein [Thermomicrobiales bacterium]
MERMISGRGMSRRELLLRAGVLTGAALGAARFGGAFAAPVAQAAKGGTLTVGHIGDVDNYDPLTDALDQFQNYGRLLLYGSLTTYDANSKVVGDLATAWDLDGSAWVFKLRDGVTWHDGSPFTAEDVKYTIERALDPSIGSFAVPFIGDKATVDVVDPLTAKINLPSVNASYPDLMTAVSIVKKDSGETNRSKPVGTGAFKFGSWSPNDQTVYVRNDKYYDPARPLLDQIVFKPMPDPQVAITNLTGGSVDLVSNQLILPQSVQSLQGQDGIQLITVDPSSQLAYANMVQKEGPLADKRVRQGLALCLDLIAVKNLVYAGTGTPTNNFMAPVTWAYVDIPPYAFDPDKAKALFAAAGFPNGFDTTIDAIEGYPDLIAIASIWQDGLKKAGVNAVPTTYEINTWLDRWNNSKYQISLNFDINGPDPQRMFTADYLLHIQRGEWADKELAKKVQDGAAAAVAVVDQAKRKAIYADLQHLLYDELPVIPIYHPAMIAAAATKVQGLVIDGKGFYHFDQATISS